MTEQEIEEAKKEDIFLQSIGECLVKSLGLKKDSRGLIQCTWGTKTELGLGRMVKRLLEEGPL